MRKKLLVILLQATSDLTEMVSYCGPTHLIIRQYMTSIQATIEVIDLIFLNLEIRSGLTLAA
jgi:hypothetical protein